MPIVNSDYIIQAGAEFVIELCIECEYENKMAIYDIFMRCVYYNKWQRQRTDDEQQMFIIY